jgi:uncharacterized membrane protein
MAMVSSSSALPPVPAKPRPFRRAVLRGLALVLPPVLTIVTLLWVAGTVQVYVLRPVTDGAREVLVWWLSDVRLAPDDVASAKPTLQFNGRIYQRLESGQYVPRDVVAGDSPLPPNARVAYEQYVSAHYLQPVVVVPVFLVVFVAVLYVLGKLFTARMGSIFEPVVRRLPLIRGVYASVKKVTDFALVDSGDVRYLRVVAIEFPRQGIWTVGLVTGEGMQDIAGAAGEPCVTVAVPGSPVPFTGNVVTVRKSAAHDLNVTIDEALQFFISCGVVVPLRELHGKEAVRNLPGDLPVQAATGGAGDALAPSGAPLSENSGSDVG